MTLLSAPADYLVSVIEEVSAKLGDGEADRLRARVQLDDEGERAAVVKELERYVQGLRGRMEALWASHVGRTVFLFRLPAVAHLKEKALHAALSAAAVERGDEDEPLKVADAMAEFERRSRTSARVIAAARAQNLDGSPVVDASVRVTSFVKTSANGVIEYHPNDHDVSLRIRWDRAAPIAEVYGAPSHAKLSIRATLKAALDSDIPPRRPKTDEYFSVVSIAQHGIGTLEKKLGLTPVGFEGDNVTGAGGWDEHLIRNKLDDNSNRRKPLNLKDASTRKQYDAVNKLREYNLDFQHDGKHKYVERNEVALHFGGDFHFASRRRLSRAALEHLIAGFCDAVGDL